MAEQKTTTTRGRKKNTEVVVEQNTELEQAKLENKQMADMLKQMQEQMAMLQAQINSQNNGQVIIKQNDDLTRTVKVISLLPWTYNISTRRLGKGKVYSFNKFGDSQNIKFSDMQDILTIAEEQFRKGYAILSSKKDYDDLGIGDIYNEVMTKEKIEELVALQNMNSVNTILEMEEDMQEVVVSTIAEKIASGISYDYNKIKILEDNGLQINERVELISASNESDK